MLHASVGGLAHWCLSLYRVLRTTDIEHFRSPDVGPPTVSVSLPKAHKLLRTVVERLSKVSKTIELKATSSGRLIISAQTATTSAVTIRTFFAGLPVSSGCDPDPNDVDLSSSSINVMPMSSSATVSVDVRKLSAVLSFQQILPSWELAVFRKCTRFLIVRQAFRKIIVELP